MSLRMFVDLFGLESLGGFDLKSLVVGVLVVVIMDV